MNLWRRTRTELAGAWRSVRYDMGRRPAEPAAGPDVTSTGMSTFPVITATRTPRRLVAVTAFGVLATAGAAGTYVAMLGGLGSLLAEKPAAARSYPLAAADSPAAPPAGESALGSATKPVAVPDSARVPVGDPGAGLDAAAVTATTPAAVPDSALPLAAHVTPERPKPPAPDPCACPAPPVPTPTQPSTSPSASPSPSPAPSESSSPSASASASASARASASGSSEAMMRRSHHRRY